MNITECISFLRFTTIHPQFDLYLITNGIRNRPQGKGGIEYLTFQMVVFLLGLESDPLMSLRVCFPSSLMGNLFFLNLWSTKKTRMTYHIN